MLDAVELAGLALFVEGLREVWSPLAFIAGGALVTTWAALASRKGQS